MRPYPWILDLDRESFAPSLLPGLAALLTRVLRARARASKSGLCPGRSGGVNRRVSPGFRTATTASQRDEHEAGGESLRCEHDAAVSSLSHPAGARLLRRAEARR